MKNNTVFVSFYEKEGVVIAMVLENSQVYQIINNN